MKKSYLIVMKNNKAISEEIKKMVEETLGLNPFLNESVNDNFEDELAGGETEDDNDLFSMIEDSAEKIEDVAGDFIKGVGTGGAPEIPMDLKIAMLITSMTRSQAEKIYNEERIKFYTEFNPKTKSKIAGEDDALVDVPEDEKVAWLSKRLADMKAKNPSVGTRRLSDQEIEDLKKKTYVPVTYSPEIPEESEQARKDKAKWWATDTTTGFRNLISLIGYDAKTKTLNRQGKGQLEFLARIAKGDVGRHSEEMFFMESSNKDLYQAKANGVLYMFFKFVLVEIIADLTRRSKSSPRDYQLHEFIEVALLGNGKYEKDSEGNLVPQRGLIKGAFESMKESYDVSRENIAAFIIQVSKHNVINQIKSISNMQFDMIKTSESLESSKFPMKVASKTSPEKAKDKEELRYDKVEGPVTYSHLTQAGPKKVSNVYLYTYNTKSDLMHDLMLSLPDNQQNYRTSRGENPMAYRNLVDKTKFYKSMPVDISSSIGMVDEPSTQQDDAFDMESDKAKKVFFSIIEKAVQEYLKSPIKQDDSGNVMATGEDYVAKNGLKKVLGTDGKAKESFLHAIFYTLTKSAKIPVYSEYTYIKLPNGKEVYKKKGRDRVLFYDENGKIVNYDTGKPVLDSDGKTPEYHYISGQNSSYSASLEDFNNTLIDDYADRQGASKEDARDFLEKNRIILTNKNQKAIFSGIISKLKEILKTDPKLLNIALSVIGSASKASDIPMLQEVRSIVRKIIYETYFKKH
jgi:hypothetical protein